MTRMVRIKENPPILTILVILLFFPIFKSRQYGSVLRLHRQKIVHLAKCPFGDLFFVE